MLTRRNVFSNTLTNSAVWIEPTGTNASVIGPRNRMAASRQSRVNPATSLGRLAGGPPTARRRGGDVAAPGRRAVQPDNAQTRPGRGDRRRQPGKPQPHNGNIKLVHGNLPDALRRRELVPLSGAGLVEPLATTCQP